VQKPRSANAKALRLQYDQERLEMRQRRLKEKEPEFLKRYRWRAGIEGTMSRLKHVMGMVRLRVRTLAKVSYVVCLKALGLNIFRCAAAGV
jgi:IS5 family transposase